MQGARVLLSGFKNDESQMLLPVIEQSWQGICVDFASVDEITNNPELTCDYDAVVLRDFAPSCSNLDFSKWSSRNGAAAIMVCVDGFEPGRVLDWMNHGAQRVIPIRDFGAYFHDCLMAVRNQNSLPVQPKIPHEVDPAAKSSIYDALTQGDALELTVDKIDAFVIIFNDAGRILFLNRCAENISGVTRNAVIGLDFFDVFLIDAERDSIRSLILSDTPQSLSQHFQSSIMCQNGGIRRLIWSTKKIKGYHGADRDVLCFGLDMTEDYLKGLAFQESEQRLSAILKSSPIGICILSLLDGTIVDANSSMGQILERSDESLIGMRVVDLGLEQSPDRFLEELEKQSLKGKHLSVERVLITKKRRKVHVLFTAEIVHWGLEKEILLMVQDITERAKIEENNRKINDGLERRVLERTAELEAVNRELQQEIGFRRIIEQSSLRLTQIIWETPDIVAICDLFGRMLYLNKAGRVALGLDDQESISHLVVYSFYPPEAKGFITEILTTIVNQEGYWYGETDLTIQNGKTIPTSQVILAHKDVNGVVQFYSTIARDISTQILAANELKRAYQQEKELGNFRSNFFAMTSHQFRTPLSTILSSAELLENYGAQWSDEKRLMHAKRIKDATHRLNTMLDEILFIGRMDAKIEGISIESVDVEEIARTMIQVAQPADTCHRDIRIIGTEEGRLIQSDPEIVERIFDNLISNAIKYSGCDTKIEMRISYGPDGARIQVVDEGIGISEEDLKLLFQPFHRGSNVVDTPGSGLGLMIVEKSLQMIHGSIEIESQLLGGTTVTVYIPDLENITR